jgi:hypothetical protein
MLLRFFVVVLFLLVLSGCGGYKKIYSDKGYTFDKNNKNGLVVMSLDISGQIDIPFSLYYARRNKKGINPSAIPLLAEYIKGESSFLHVFEIAPGQYEFNGLYIELGYKQATRASGGKYSIPFEVVAGKVNYIGRIYVRSTDIGNSDFIIESKTSRSDQFDEDIALFSREYPGIDTDNINAIDSEEPELGKQIRRIHLGSEYEIIR